MTRKEFIEKLPIGAALAFTVMCPGACGKRLMEEVNETTVLRTDTIPNPDPEMIDFTISLDDPDYKSLNDLEGYAYYEKVIIANTATFGFIAATKICSDEYLPRMIWENDEWLCEEHGATFDTQGKGTTTYNDLGKNGIDIYQVEQTGRNLRIFSV